MTEDRIARAREALEKYIAEYEDAPSWGGPTIYPARPSIADLRTVTAALASLPDDVSDDPWQPIETAPKDGTAFVGSDGKYAYRTKLDRYYVKWPHEEGGPTYEDKWNAEDSGSIWPWEPTHWQPLPAPPAAIRKATA